MPFDFLAILEQIMQIGFLAKVFLITLTFFYIIFSIVVYRQTSLMSQTIQSGSSSLIKFVALCQIVVVLGLFLLGFVLL